MHQPLGMQVPHKLQRDAFSRGNSNTDSNRDRCARGGRRWLLHAGLSMCMLGCTALMGEFPWLPQQICPIYLGFSVVIFPLRGFHCSPGAGRVSRTGFWSKQGSAVETQPKVFCKSTMEEEFKPSALCQTKCRYPGLSPTAQQASAAQNKQGREKFQCPEI